MPPQNSMPTSVASTLNSRPSLSPAIMAFRSLIELKPGTRAHRRVGIMALLSARRAMAEEAPAPAVQRRPFELPPAEVPRRWNDSRGLAVKGLILGVIFAPVGLVTAVIALRRQQTQVTKALSIIAIVVSLIGIMGLGIAASKVYATIDTARQHNLDTQHQDELSATQSLLEAVFISNGTYPTLAQLNSAAWRSQNLRGNDFSDFSPASGSTQLVAGQPTQAAYAYNAVPPGCTASKQHPCTSFSLSAKLSNGQTYSLQ